MTPGYCTHDNDMEFEGSNKIGRRNAEESVQISECIDKKTAEESVDTSENIEKRNVDTCHAQVATGEEELVEPVSFKLCGDNLDKTVKRRYMLSYERNQSLQYFHSYVVLDRSGLSNMFSLARTDCKIAFAITFR